MVIPLKYWDILDFKSLQKENYKNTEQNKISLVNYHKKETLSGIER